MISLTVDHGKAFGQYLVLLEGLEEALDPEEILDQAASTMLSRTLRRFREKRTPDGRPWKVSKASQIRARGGYTWSNGRKWTGGDVLYASGKLFSSFSLIDDGLGQRRIINDAPYAVYLNGDPNYEFLGAGEQDIQVILNIINDRISKAK